MKNIFVVGLDDFNHRKLQTLRGAADCRFHPLLRFRQLQGPDALPIDVALNQCDRILHDFDGTIDAIIGYWDFPITDMVPILCRSRGLPASSLVSILRCEHKYWCRLVEARIIPEYIPAFQAVNPHNETEIRDIKLSYPYWMKPIKSTDSVMAFKISNEQDRDRAVSEFKKQIGMFCKPFKYLMGFAELPPEITAASGRDCLVEAPIDSGRQCTVEGYVYRGQVHVHGIIDSYRYPGVSSFFRYQYPSRLKRSTKRRLREISRKVINELGLDNTTWNIEFFADERSDRLRLLEVNPRISQSHAHMFELVDGASNLEIVLALGQGKKPEMPVRQGRFKCASKFYLRVFEDAWIKRVPSPREVRKIEKRFPGTLIEILAGEGMRLSDIPGQDSYSYRVAHIHMGAQNTRRLLEKFRACRDLLRFEFSKDERPLAPLSGTNGEAPAHRAR